MWYVTFFVRKDFSDSVGTRQTKESGVSVLHSVQVIWTVTLGH